MRSAYPVIYDSFSQQAAKCIFAIWWQLECLRIQKPSWVLLLLNINCWTIGLFAGNNFPRLCSKNQETENQLESWRTKDCWYKTQNTACRYQKTPPKSCFLLSVVSGFKKLRHKHPSLLETSKRQLWSWCLFIEMGISQKIKHLKQYEKECSLFLPFLWLLSSLIFVQLEALIVMTLIFSSLHRLSVRFNLCLGGQLRNVNVTSRQKKHVGEIKSLPCT